MVLGGSLTMWVGLGFFLEALVENPFLASSTF
jgi:hypothetical protein